MTNERKEHGTLRAGRQGFTLVELIVVIAILGILAGIAIPVYSGYIKKANQAADEQLLAALNSAAAASVLDVRNEDMIKLADGALSATKDAPISLTDPSNDKVGDVFAEKYFKGNEGASFKYFTELKFKDGVFVGVGPDGSTTGPTGHILKEDWEWLGDLEGAKAAYNASNWKEMGVDGLTGTVDYVTDALAHFGNVMNVLSGARGFDEVAAKFGIEDISTADKATLANATVFYVAERLANLDATEIRKALVKDARTGTGTGSANLDAYLADKGITPDGNGYREYQLVNATLKYAVAVAYANSGVDADLKESITNGSLGNYADVMNIYKQAVESGTPFTTYLTNPDLGSKSDLDAFISILDVFNQNIGAFNDISGSGLFSNPEIKAAINQILGTDTQEEP